LPLKVEHKSKLETMDMRMIKWILGVSLTDKIPCTELRARIGVEPIREICSRNRLRWFGHAERWMLIGDWVKRCTKMEVEGNRPRKT
jgi:hypothetical protein